MAKKRSIYSVHPSIELVQAQIARLKGKTERTLDQWVAFIDRSNRRALLRVHLVNPSFGGFEIFYRIGVLFALPAGALREPP